MGCAVVPEARGGVGTGPASYGSAGAGGGRRPWCGAVVGAGARRVSGSSDSGDRRGHSAPARRSGTRGRESGRAGRSLACVPAERLSDRLVNLMPGSSPMFHLIRLTTQVKGLLNPMSGYLPQQPSAEAPLRFRDRTVIHPAPRGVRERCAWLPRLTPQTRGAREAAVNHRL
ncbi:protein of unknown function [Streptantibioticus cattleyicolor NRRL 8057 = DSM 46488]|nr:protein of unknown function [Streptantibioticus cattleyicolor NRRL 8057 = DSM 46488]